MLDLFPAISLIGVREPPSQSLEFLFTFDEIIFDVLEAILFT